MRLLLLLALPVSLLATDPHLGTKSVLAIGGATRPAPCIATATCPANAQILFDAPTSPTYSCSEIHSMDTSGGHAVDISQNAAWIANTQFTGGTSVTTAQLNFGAASYSPDGNWIIFALTDYRNLLPCSLVDVGAGPNSDIAICSATNPGSNCTIVSTLTFPNLGEGNLWPHFTRDGTKVFWAHQNVGLFNVPPGVGALRWAPFTAGTPPTIGSVHNIDPAGTGSFTTVAYEPSDSSPDGCTLYFTATLTAGYNSTSTAEYNICTGSGYRVLSAPYNPATPLYNEWWAFNSNDDIVLTTSSAFYTGLYAPNGTTTDLVVTQGNSGQGAYQATGFNNASWPEYNPQTVVKDPRWLSDNSAIVFGISTNSTIQHTANNVQIWKYTWVP